MVAFFTVSFCLLPLFLFPERIFGGMDWVNSLWMAQYNQLFWKAHQSMPEAFQTNELIGSPFPVFYAGTLYKFLGLISLGLGLHGAITATLFALFFVQWKTVESLIYFLTQDKFIAGAVAAMVTFAVYPLTNLYSRSAIPELVSTLLFVIAITLWLRATWESEEHRKRKILAAWGICTLLFQSTHPITAFYGTLFQLLLCLVTMKLKEGVRFKTIFLSVLLGLTPLVYLYFSFAKKVGVTKTLGVPTVIPGVDTWWVRLLPIPFDGRAYDVITPNFDTQINSILLGFLLIIAGFGKIPKKAKWFLILGSILFLFSISPFLSKQFLLIVGKMQYAFRFVTYINASVFIALCIVLRNKQSKLLYSKKIVLALLLVAICGVCIKTKSAVKDSNLVTAQQLPKWEAVRGSNATHLPTVFYGRDDYSLLNYYPPIGETNSIPVQQVYFNVLAQERFGEVEPLSLKLNNTGFVIFPVQAFPWNHLIINGKKAETLSSRNLLAVNLPKGEYSIQYIWEPDLLWRFCEISKSLAVLILITLFASFSSLSKKNHN